MQNDKPLNCPFCDKKLKRIKNGYEHKSSQCILSSFIFTDVEVGKWNTRKPMERIVEQLERVKPEGAIAKNVLNYAIYLVRKGGVDNAE